MSNYWLVKSEPETYSWAMFVTEQRTAWTGVRNYQARNNLKTMKINDLVLFYHSVKSPSVVGIAQVVAEAYQDPTTSDKNWVAVDLIPLQALPKVVSLSQIKIEPALSGMALLRLSRLSVSPVTADEFGKLLSLGGLESLEK